MKFKTGSKLELVVGCDIEVVVGDIETGHRLRRVGCISVGAVDCGVEAENSDGGCECAIGGDMELGAGRGGIGRLRCLGGLGGR